LKITLQQNQLEEVLTHVVVAAVGICVFFAYILYLILSSLNKRRETYFDEESDRKNV